MSLLLALTLALEAAPVQATAAGDWPHWRGPHFDGISRETGLLKSWPENGPRVLWKAELSGGYSSVAVAQGRVYTHTAKDKKEEIVVCLDAATGKEVWRHRYDCDYDKHATLAERFDHGPRATPAVDGDFVYTIGTTGVVLCLEAQTGKRVWQQELLKIGGRRCPGFGYCTSPVVAGELLLVHPGGSKGNSIAALDKTDGRLVWQALNDRLSHATPILIEFDGSPQVVCFTSQGVVGVAPKDGKVLWRHDLGGAGGPESEFNFTAATPVFADGLVFVSPSRAGGGTLLRLKKEGDPERVWKNTVLQTGYSTPVLYEGHLYGFSNSRLRCVEAATGRVRWDKTGLGKGSLLIVDGHLIILSERGDLVLAEATPKEYKEKSRCQPLRGSCLSVPVLAGGRLFMRNENVLLALDLKGTDNKD